MHVLRDNSWIRQRHITTKHGQDMTAAVINIDTIITSFHSKYCEQMLMHNDVCFRLSCLEVKIMLVNADHMVMAHILYLMTEGK